MRGTWQTTGGSGGSGGLVLAVIAAVVLIGSGALTAIVHALEVVVIVLGCTIALAAVGGIALLVYRTRQDRPGAVYSTRAVSQLPPEPRPQLSPPYKPAVEPAREIHLHLHGLTPDQLAAIATHRYLEEDR